MFNNNINSTSTYNYNKTYSSNLQDINDEQHYRRKKNVQNSVTGGSGIKYKIITIPSLKTDPLYLPSIDEIVGGNPDITQILTDATKHIDENVWVNREEFESWQRKVAELKSIIDSFISYIESISILLPSDEKTTKFTTKMEEIKNTLEKY